MMGRVAVQLPSRAMEIIERSMLAKPSGWEMVNGVFGKWNDSE